MNFTESLSHPNPSLPFSYVPPLNPNRPGTIIMSFSTPRRRRPVHRLRRRGKEIPKPISFEPSKSDSGGGRLVIDVEQLKATAATSMQRLLDTCESKYDEFVYSATEVYEDLQTLIMVDPRTNRVVVSCEDSTVRFLGGFAVWSIVVLVAIRGLFKLVSWLRRWNGVGMAEGEVITRRDRSLGGREVVVARASSGVGSRRKNYDDEVRELESFLGSVGGGQPVPVRKGGRKLPGWWPATVSTKPTVETGAGEMYQRAVNRLIAVIMDDKISGKDISEAHILQLRQMCRKFGVTASIQTANTRDSIFRAAVNFIINTSSRAKTPVVEVDGEDAREFTAGLASNIGLESTRAASIVSGTVAARTRLWFLQAWALEMQGKHSEVLEELSKICVIHQLFPPEEFSPEMEMVARGLERNLKPEQREILLNKFTSLCNEQSRSVAEALGLLDLPKSADKLEDKRPAES